MLDAINKLPLLLFCILYLAWVGYDWSEAETSPTSPIFLKTGQIAAAKATLEATQNKIKETQKFLQALEVKKIEIQTLARELSEMKTSISDGADTAKFVKMVVAEAAKVGLKIKGLKPLGRKDVEHYTEYSFDLSFTGAFVQVLVFLDRITNIDSIVRAENLKIKRTGSPIASIVEVEGQMQLKTFRYLGGHADDVAQKSVVLPVSPGAPPETNLIDKAAPPAKGSAP